MPRSSKLPSEKHILLSNVGHFLLLISLSSKGKGHYLAEVCSHNAFWTTKGTFTYGLLLV